VRLRPGMGWGTGLSEGDVLPFGGDGDPVLGGADVAPEVAGPGVVDGVAPGTGPVDEVGPGICGGGGEPEPGDEVDVGAILAPRLLLDVHLAHEDVVAGEHVAAP
jgi:hypothetical protein